MPKKYPKSLAETIELGRPLSEFRVKQVYGVSLKEIKAKALGHDDPASFLNSFGEILDEALDDPFLSALDAVRAPTTWAAGTVKRGLPVTRSQLLQSRQNTVDKVAAVRKMTYEKPPEGVFSRSSKYVNSQTLMYGGIATVAAMTSKKSDKRATRSIGMAVAFISFGLLAKEILGTKTRNDYLDNQAGLDASKSAIENISKTKKLSSAVGRAAKISANAEMLTKLFTNSVQVTSSTRSELPSIAVDDVSAKRASSAIAKNDFNSVSDEVKIKWVEKRNYNFPPWVDPSEISTGPSNPGTDEARRRILETVLSPTLSPTQAYGMGMADTYAGAGPPPGPAGGTDAVVTFEDYYHRGEYKVFFTSRPIAKRDKKLAIHIEGLEKQSGCTYIINPSRRRKTATTSSVVAPTAMTARTNWTNAPTLSSIDNFGQADIQSQRDITKGQPIPPDAIYIGSIKRGSNKNFASNVPAWFYINSMLLHSHVMSQEKSKWSAEVDYYRWFSSNFQEPTSGQLIPWWEPVITNLGINYKCMCMDEPALKTWIGGYYAAAASPLMRSTFTQKTAGGASMCKIMSAVLSVVGAVVSLIPVAGQVVGPALIAVGAVIGLIENFVISAQAGTGSLLAAAGDLMRGASGILKSYQGEFNTFISETEKVLERKFAEVGVKITSTQRGLVTGKMKQIGGDIKSGMGNIVEVLQREGLVSSNQLSQIKRWNLDEVNKSLRNEASAQFDRYKAKYRNYAFEYKAKILLAESVLREDCNIDKSPYDSGRNPSPWGWVKKVELFCDEIDTQSRRQPGAYEKI